jgi:RNA polymerase sigma-70 factor, ECF subfamily
MPSLSEVAGPAVDAEAAADRSLIARLKNGDGDAYEEAVRVYSGRLLAVTRRILGNDEEARDALQDTFLSAFRSITRFEGDSRLSTWLHRIAVNAALMKVRTRKRKPERSIEDLLPAYREDGHHAEGFVSWDPPVDVAMEIAHNRALVRECIAELPEQYRVVLMLRDIEDVDTVDVAAMLAITPNAVKIRLHRARQALRTLLAPHFKKEVEP